MRTIQRVQLGTDADTLLQDHVRHSAVCAIFFSNVIEEAGVSLTEMMQLVEVVLSGDTVPYDQLGSVPAARRSRLEVLQHAATFVFMRDCMVRDKQPLSSALICVAHRMLMTDMLREDGLRVEAGSYRTTPASAGWHQFPPATCIDRSMKDLVQAYNERAADTAEDPFVLAAWLSYEFVSIHPFEDGNGRMCRLLLNMALLTHGVPFCSALGFSSGHRQAKKHYMECIHHAREHGGHPSKLAFVVCAASAKAPHLSLRPCALLCRNSSRPFACEAPKQVSGCCSE